MDIAGKTMLVTGAASGMGKACAVSAKEKGLKVILVDYNDEVLNIAAAIDMPAYKLDITDSQEVEKFFISLNNDNQAIDILINCAGVAPAKKILGKKGLMPLEHFTNTINVNLIGNFNIIRHTVNLMQKNIPNNDNERGVIINTASIAAFEGQIGQAAYSASKGGIVSMTLPLARELAAIGVRVMCIAPGLIDTAMLQSFTDEVRASLAAQMPFPNRFGKPEEYADLIWQIISNPLLNGETIRLDGGIRMQPR